MTAAPTAAARWLAGLVVAVTLFWWPLTDQLELPKQAVLLLGALAASAWALAARRPWPLSALGLGLGLAALVGVALAPGEAGARIEGWAGWLAAGAVVGLAGHASGEPAAREWLARALARLGVALAAVAWLQAAGLQVFNADLAGFEGRRVVGTLGGPGHLGWTLALLLPWVGAQLASRVGRRAWLARAALGLVAGALLLSGSRTAWAMTLAGLPFWLRRAVALPALACLLLGGLAGLSLDLATGQARLPQRAQDLASPSGTAAGRLYLARLYLSAAPGLWRSPGGGPEAFQRAFPGWQDAYLAAHPEEVGFCSDLRHAHLDALEVLCDFGPAGLLVLLSLLGLGLGRRPPGGGARAGPERAGLAAAAMGGLASPVLFFAPSLALAALCLGLGLGPVRRPCPAWVGALALGALLAAGALLAPRLASELVRSEASLARAEGRLARARERAERAARLDDRNPRAWIELALTCRAQAEPGCAREALRALGVDLPLSACLAAGAPAGSAPRSPGPP